MRYKFLFWALISAQFLTAQSFKEVPHFNSFEGVYNSCVAIADVDGDTFPDLLVTGRKNGNTLSSKLYINDGAGNFSERVDPPFLSVESGSMAVADFNGDQHLDVILTGRLNQYGRFPPGAKLYINDGTGIFEEMEATSLSRVSNSAIAVADVNGDGFIDVLITGKDMSGNPIAKLYTNDGEGHFTEVLNTPFVGVDRGAVAISDLNGDSHADILITGKKGSFSFTSKLYINDGSGHFSEMPNTPFVDVFLSTIAIEDVNQDRHPDVVISGVGDSFVRSTKLYINDGLGNFTEMPDILFDGMNWSSVAIVEVTGDQYPDLLCAGESSGRNEKTKLYANDGLGNFTELPESPFDDVSSSRITIGDVDGDQQNDVIITGKKFGLSLLSVYTHSGNGHFKSKKELPFARVYLSSASIVDLNDDQHPDLLITGRTGISNFRYDRRTILYINDGTGRFSDMDNSLFTGVSNSAVAVTEVNSDKNLDILISGITKSDEPVTKLYSGGESGQFKEVSSSFEGLYEGSVAMADVDANQYPDILITGQKDYESAPITKLYLNNGRGKFKEVQKAPFPGVRNSAVAIADVNSDQAPDIFITGEDNLKNAVTKLFLNTGSGKFLEMKDVPFPGVFHSSVAIADVTGDGHSDIFLSGLTRIGDLPITKFYVNTGSGHFTEVKNTPFEGVYAGSVVIADVNGDQIPDVFISGQKESKDYISKLYINDGSGNFTELAGTPFKGVGWGSVTIEDVTGDDRPDILITGKTSSTEIARLYIQSGK